AQETAQAVSDASAIATSIGKDLDRAQDAIRLFGGDPSLADVLDGTGGSGLKRAQSSLKALATRAGGAVESVSLVDPDGNARLTVVNGKVVTSDHDSHPDAILSSTLQVADG